VSDGGAMAPGWAVPCTAVASMVNHSAGRAKPGRPGTWQTSFDPPLTGEGLTPGDKCRFSSIWWNLRLQPDELACVCARRTNAYAVPWL